MSQSTMRSVLFATYSMHIGGGRVFRVGLVQYSIPPRREVLIHFHYSAVFLFFYICRFRTVIPN